MQNYFEILQIIIILSVFSYGLLRQLKQTKEIIRSNTADKRTVVGSCICSISFFIFLISYIFNIISVKILKYFNLSFLNSLGTICTISIIAFFISKYFIIKNK